MTILVLLVHDHPVVRKGILEILKRAADIDMIAETAKGETALDLMIKMKFRNSS